MDSDKQQHLLQVALILSLITIFYNLLEGLFSIIFAVEGQTLALLGFGVDSFVEVISGVGIAHMVLKMRASDDNKKDRFERTALMITGTSFFILAAGLVAGAVLSGMHGRAPTTTVAGIIISLISIVAMLVLAQYKMNVGRKMASEAIIADARNTRMCLYLSVILLVSSGLYEIFHLYYIDLFGSLAIAIFAFAEGLEAFEKAAKKQKASAADQQ
jgi:divalent metal cation (Fe/Co/Zn/Cd) transporter